MVNLDLPDRPAYHLIQLPSCLWLVCLRGTLPWHLRAQSFKYVGETFAHFQSCTLSFSVGETFHIFSHFVCI
jgi:hypothetical protein